MVTLGHFASTLVNNVIHNRGTTDQQAGTLMHELGHNLGLRHGGLDNVNCKPNYLSVMNYSRQFSNIIAGRRLDYSRNELPDLDENNGPSEAAGLGGGASPPLPANEQTAFGYVGSKNVNNYKVVPLPAASIDWNQKSGQTASNVNRIDAVGCDGIPNPTVLHGFNDWENFHFNLRASLEFAGGGDTEQEEVTSEADQLAFWSLDSDASGPGAGKGDGLDCSNNPDQGISQTSTVSAMPSREMLPTRSTSLLTPVQRGGGGAPRGPLVRAPRQREL